MTTSPPPLMWQVAGSYTITASTLHLLVARILSRPAPRSSQSRWDAKDYRKNGAVRSFTVPSQRPVAVDAPAKLRTVTLVMWASWLLVDSFTLYW